MKIIVLGVTAMLTTTSVSHAQCESGVRFRTMTKLDGVEPGPRTIDAGDVNNDGRNDVVYTMSGVDGFFVHAQTDAGMFDSPLEYKLSERVQDHEVVDVNLDGLQDLVLACLDPLGLEVYLGDDNGGLNLVPNPHVARIDRIDIADLNGDDIPDLMALSWSENSVRFYYGNGDGTFTNGIVIEDSEFHELEATDFNGDGHTDILLNSYFNDPAIRALYNNGDGGFDHWIDFDPSGGFESVTSIDANGDGRTDIAYANSNAEIWIYEAVSGDTFLDPVIHHISRRAESLSVIDLNGDGALDLGCGVRQDIEILLNDGRGDFESAGKHPAGEYVSHHAFADLNDDGLLDILISDSDQGIFMIPGNGDGTFDSIPHVDLGARPIDVQFADMNLDGVLDLLTVHDYPEDRIEIHIAAEDGTFMDAVTFNLVDDVRSSAIGDINLDGRVDVITVGMNNVQVLQGVGGGLLPPVRYEIPGTTSSIVVADFDGNGTLDLCIPLDFGSEDIVALNPGNGDFSDHTMVSSGVGTQLVQAADFNGDGVADLALAGRFGDDAVSVHLSQPDGTFSPFQNYPVSEGTRFMRVADLNTDGLLDIAVISYSDTPVVDLLLNDGEGAFTLGIPVTSTDLATLFDAGDFDGDGDVDLVLVSDVSRESTIFINDGTGVLEESADFYCSPDPVAVLALDFDGSGRSDLVVIDHVTADAFFFHTECILCPADLNGSAEVGTDDLLALLASWGVCADECPADLNDDQQVDVTDLLILLAAWGPCS